MLRSIELDFKRPTIQISYLPFGTRLVLQPVTMFGKTTLLTRVVSLPEASLKWNSKELIGTLLDCAVIANSMRSLTGRLKSVLPLNDKLNVGALFTT